MARQVAEGRLSASELVRAHLARIETLQPRLNAFAHVDRAGALAAARVADLAIERGEPRGPLHGVPLSIKSSLDVAGWPCETGTRLRAGQVATSDAPLVARLRQAGAILLGNSNVPELLMAYETDNLLHGRTSNPWDLARTPGGSSGGESAAIAAGCSAGGVGSDGGGSIRVPAHFTGICGLKPTPGRIPATGHFPVLTGPFAQLGVVGPMARTVADVELLARVISGSDDGDVRSTPLDWRRVSDEEARRLRVGFFEDDGIEPVTAETRAAVQSAAKALEAQGYVVEPFRPAGLEAIRESWWFFFGRCAAQVIRPLFDGRESDMAPTTLKYFAAAAAAPPPSGADILTAWFARDELTLALRRQMQRFPILLCPVSSGPAFRHGEGSFGSPGVNYLEEMRYCQWFNLTGNPAVAVPVGRSPQGLPIGVQVVARHHREEEALGVARAIERAGGGFRRPPI
jgi:Asp-tRNA(Asn)/Glu-tRNA(Gln) amidotransferase A subunit family amidase